MLLVERSVSRWSKFFHTDYWRKLNIGANYGRNLDGLGLTFDYLPCVFLNVDPEDNIQTCIIIGSVVGVVVVIALLVGAFIFYKRRVAAKNRFRLDNFLARKILYLLFYFKCRRGCVLKFKLEEKILKPFQHSCFY